MALNPSNGSNLEHLALKALSICKSYRMSYLHQERVAKCRRQCENVLTFGILGKWMCYASRHDYKRQHARHYTFCLLSTAIVLDVRTVTNATVQCEINFFQNYFSLVSVWNKFISVRGNVPKIISKPFQRPIAARECFPTCSVSLK